MPDPKETPKSIPNISPSVVLTKKFSKCLSPMPNKYDAILNTAKDLTN